MTDDPWAPDHDALAGGSGSGGFESGWELEPDPVGAAPPDLASAVKVEGSVDFDTAGVAVWAVVGVTLWWAWSRWG